jgi:hypothetical protein
MSTSSPTDSVDADTHRRLAVDLFNHVWTLLETEDRSQEQDDEMVHAAHASCWHWAQTGDAKLPQRLAVGEWQCSRVYAVLGRPDAALHHAGRCVAIAEGAELEAWVLASAYEAMARAAMVAGDTAELGRWRDRAREAADRIDDAEQRQVIDADLATLA